MTYKPPIPKFHGKPTHLYQAIQKFSVFVSFLHLFKSYLNRLLRFLLSYLHYHQRSLFCYISCFKQTLDCSPPAHDLLTQYNKFINPSSNVLVKLIYALEVPNINFLFHNATYEIQLIKIIWHAGIGLHYFIFPTIQYIPILVLIPLILRTRSCVFLYIFRIFLHGINPECSGIWFWTFTLGLDIFVFGKSQNCWFDLK